MQEQAYVTVATTNNSQEAESVTNTLQQAGLHPAPVAATVPLPIPDMPSAFPVDVPSEEAPLAQQILKSHYLAKEPG